MSFSPTGVEFVAKNLRGYLSELRQADQAQQTLGRSVASIGSSFNQAKGNVANFGSSLSGSVAGVSSFGSALSNMAQVAGGILATQVFNRIADGVGVFISSGVEAVSKSQLLEASLNALLTQNNLYAQSTETVTTAITKQLMTQDEYQLKVRELNAELATQQATYNEQTEKIRQLTEQYGENGLDVLQNKARHEELAIEMEKTRREIDGLITSETSYTTATKTAWTQVMDLEEAQRLAATQTKELTGFVEKLAIVSPFEQEDVEKVTQYAVGAGLGVDVTKRFTSAFLDWSAAVGINSANLDEAAYQLLQVKKAGQITAVDLRQLSTRGLDLAKVIGVEMGMSVDEFNAKAAKSPEIFDELIDAIVRYSNNTFAGTSQAMSNSIEGLKSTLSDLFTQSAKKVLRPLVDAVSPTISEMIARAADFVSGGGAERIGQALADSVMEGFSRISEIVGKIQSAFSKFGIKGAAVSIMGQLGFDQDAISKVTPIITAITQAFDKIQGAYQRFGAKGAARSILGQLGLDPAIVGTVTSTINNIITTVSTGFGKISKAYSKFGIKGAAVSLLGQLGLDPETIGVIRTNIDNVVNTVTEKFNILKTVYEQFGLAGAGVSLLSMLGFSSETIATITNIVSQIATVLSSLGSAELIGGLAGVGTVLAGIIAGGVIASIVAGLMTILTPINLIIAGAALLGAAWMGNWMNIQGVAQQAVMVLTTVFSTLSAIVMSLVNTITTNVIPPLQQAFNNITLALNNMGLTWGDVWNSLVTATTIVAGAVGVAILGVIGAITGLVAGFANAFATFSSYAVEFQTAFSNIFNGIVQIIQGAIQVIVGMITGDTAMVFEGFGTQISGAMDLAQGAIELFVTTAKSSLSGVISFTRGFVTTFIGFFSGFAPALGPKFEEIVETAKDIITDATKWGEIGEAAMSGLLNGIKKHSGIVLEYLKSLLGSFLDVFTGSDGLDAHSPSRVMMDIGKDAIRGLQIGAENASGALYNSLGGITKGAIDTLMTGMTVHDKGFKDRLIDDLDLGGLLRGGGSLTGMGLGGGHLRDVRKIIHGGIRGNIGLLESGGSVGDISNIAGGIAQQFNLPPSVLAQYVDLDKQIGHLTGTFGTMFDRMRIENLKGSVGLVGQFAGIGQAFADMVTQETEAVTGLRAELNKLLGEGDKLNAAYDKQKNKLATLQEELAVLTTGQGKNAMAIEKVTESLAFGERQLAIYNEELAALTPDTLPWDKKKLAIDKLTETMDMQRQELEKLQAANSADALAIEKKTLAIDELTTELAENQKAIEANAQAAQKQRKELELMAFDMFSSEDASIKSQTAMIDLLQEFINSQQQSLFIQADEASQAAGITGILYDRISAQAELNRLLVEQQQRQEEILAIEKAQKDMAFLQQQISLLDLIQSRGLNPADILGGITLGLEAKASDLLTVTSNIVTAMVDQINKDLQIASPSKVMARIGRRVIEGMAVGIDRGQNLLSEAVRQIPILNGNVPQPAFSQAAMAGGNTYNTYYEMPMTVNTAATPQGVIRQYEIKRSMYAAA